MSKSVTRLLTKFYKKINGLTNAKNYAAEAKNFNL